MHEKSIPNQSLLADKVDSGADLLLAGAEQEAEQGLREAAGDRRNPDLRCYESSDGEALGSLMRLFRLFLDGDLGRSYGSTAGGLHLFVHFRPRTVTYAADRGYRAYTTLRRSVVDLTRGVHVSVSH